MGSQLPVECVGVVALHAHQRQLRTQCAHCAPHDVLLGLKRLVGEDGVDVHITRHGSLNGFQRVVLADFRLVKCRVLTIVVICVRHTVVKLAYGVDVVYDFLHALRFGTCGYACHVGHVESSVKVEHYAFGRERLAAVGDARTARDVLRAHILKPLSAVQRQQQVFLLGCRLQHSRVGEDDGGILISARHLVDGDAIQLARCHVLLLHIQVAIGDSVVEYSLGYLQLGVLLLHREQQLAKRLVGVRHNHILEIIRHPRDNNHYHNQRAECLHQ